jgi:thioredoxin-related protein
MEVGSFMKNIENEKIENKVEVKKNNNSDIAIVLMLVLIMGLFMVAGFFLFRSRIIKLEEELVHTKEVLSEYGIYIDEQPQTDSSYDTSVYNIIKPSQIEQESKGKTIVLWIGRQSCGYCGMYAPYINEATNNYGIKAYYVDLAGLIEFNTAQPYITDEEEFGILSGLKGEGKWDGFAEENVGGTPLTLIIKNNKVIGGLSGYADTNTIMQVFEDAGLKKN